MSEIKMKNQVKLVGTVTDLDDGIAMVKTVRKDEFKEGVEYTDFHEVDLAGTKVKTGDKVMLFGSLINREEGFSSIVKAIPNMVKKVKKSSIDCNLVKVVGQVARRFGYLAPKGTGENAKQGLGNLKMVVDGNFINATLYRGAAARLDASPFAKKGAVIEMVGRLQRREGTYRGEKQVFVEVIPDENKIEYLAEPIAEADPFEDMDAAFDNPEQAEGTPKSARMAAAAV